MANLVLITGTSSGIGLSSAVECAAAGFRVVATMRNVARRDALERAAASRGARVDIEQLDVTAENVGETLKELILKHGPPFGLVNNAGIAVGGPFEEHSERDIRDQFETNVFGLMAVTRAVLPAMRAAGRGRIVNMSSLSGLLGLPFVSTYAATKHAIEGFSEGLRWELEPFGIDVCLIEPGAYKTAIFIENQRLAEHLDPNGPYASMIAVIEQATRKNKERMPPPDDVGRIVARLLRSARPPFRTRVGADATALVALRRMMPDRLFATGLRRFFGPSRPR